MFEDFPLDDFNSIEQILGRFIQTAEHKMNDVIRHIFEHITDLVDQSLYTMITTYYEDVKCSRVNVRFEYVLFQSILSDFSVFIVYGRCE